MIQEDKLKEAQRLYETANADQRYVLERLFPELKESEDERTRKEIVRFIRMEVEDEIVGNKWLAWLEKQGEQKPQGKSALEPIKEEKVDNANKVEPKFKVGDWITDGNITIQIEAIKNDCYLYCGDCALYSIKTADKVYHLWTINDAKDGDVLSYVTDEEDLWIMIYWSLYKPYEGHVHYHALLVNDYFSDKGTCCICIDDLKPATKEQRDLLFAKMKDSGYEWDADNKKLKLRSNV